MRELLSTRHYKAGYDIRKERISGDEAGGGSSFEMSSAFTPSGDYIGNPKRASSQRRRNPITTSAPSVSARRSKSGMAGRIGPSMASVSGMS